MGIELPAELADVAAKAGVVWPKADEDAMRASAAAWRDAGDKIKGLGTSCDGAANRALGGVRGAAGDAARGRWSKVVAPDGELQRAARGCHAAADRLDHAAKQVGAAKVEIVRELVTLAKNTDAAHTSANAGNPNALLGLDTLTKGVAANVANLQNTLSSAIRLDSGVDMTHGSQPVNTAPGAHGPGTPGAGLGLLGPVVDVVGGVVAPVAEAVAPVVEPVAAVVAPVTEAVAPVVGAVTAPVAPVVGAVAAPLAPVVETVTEAVEPVLEAAAPVTEPAAAAVRPVVDAVPGARETVGPVLDGPGEHGRGDGPGHGPNPGQGHGPGQGEGRPQGLPHVVNQVVAPVAAQVADVIPSVHGQIGPIADGATQTAGAAVLEQPLVRGGEVPGQAPAAAAPAAGQAASAAPAGPAGPAVGGGPVAGGPGGAPAAAVPAQGGAVAGQPGAAQAASQAAGQQAQAAQQAAKGAEAKGVDAKAADAKAADTKTGGEGKSGASGSGSGAAGKSGAGGGAVSGGQATAVGQSSATGQSGGASGQASAGGQASGQPGSGLKDGAAKDLAKDVSAAAGLDDSAEDDRPAAQAGDTVTAPSAPGAAVDLGERQVSGSLTDRLDNHGRENLALVDPGVAGDVLRHTYTALAAGSWFMAVFLSAGQAPRLAPKPARQLPPPPQEQERVTPRFAPGDHPRAGLVSVVESRASVPADGLGKDHPVVRELLDGYDPLGGMHEHDWESLFLAGDGTPRWPVEREGGYEDSLPEVLPAGAELDRFGTPEGRVLSTAGTPFAQRSLPPRALDEGYRRYRVEKDLPVHRTISAPWFGQPGGGSRYRTTHPVADLVALGYLTEVTA
ncbi:Protein of unknown function [Lentzea fradiae]|uniref:DUF4237 domain-containing protein n=1 Tax=Lentzea fradiae TaxID=200378 RepID=A0A1G7PY57_9PSEU|nr:TNT domain-containing protein [Lentzea fradiae]SDF91153.1 Protein of unknown function [Lentzea fradiae]